MPLHRRRQGFDIEILLIVVALLEAIVDDSVKGGDHPAIMAHTGHDLSEREPSYCAAEKPGVGATTSPGLFDGSGLAGSPIRS